MITQQDVIYFILTDRFSDGDATNNHGVDKDHSKGYHGGDLQGIIDKIDYITNLGVTAIWITPVYLNTTGFEDHRPYHYYWPKDFAQIDSRLYSGNAYPQGSIQYLTDFVQVLKGHGLKVILDVVVNHGGYGISEQNPLFNDPFWFNNHAGGNDEVNSSLAGLPDFNHDSVNVVDYFINNLIQWISSTGIDGLRMDTAKHVEPKFWYYYKSIIKGKHPDLFLVGEVLDTRNVAEIAKYQRVHDFNSVFDFPLREAIKDCFIYDVSLKTLARPRLNANEPNGILDLDSAETGGYTNANRLVTLLDNHDLDQRITSIARGKHQGENNKGLAFQIVELCYAFLFTVRGIPQIYYGSELGLEGWKVGTDDSDLRRDFPWNIIGVVAPKEEYRLEANLFAKVKTLIAFRKRNEALMYGVTITLWVDDFVLAFLRFLQNHVVLAVFNNGYSDMPSPLAIPILRNTSKELQNLPDRLISRIESKTFRNIFDNNDKIRLFSNAIPVKLKGKDYKIYELI